MNKIIGDNFSKEIKYKLYRSINEIIHPTISKRNVSNYKIVVDEKLFPIVVYYPKRISNLKSAIIFIPGDGRVSGCFGKYDEICRNLAIETNNLVIAIDYFEDSIKYPTTINKCFNILKYITYELEKNGICRDNIILMGDSTGANILSSAVNKMVKKNIYFSKMILLYPALRYDYSNYIFDDSYINLNFNLDKKIIDYFKKFIGNNNADDELLNKNDFTSFPKTLVIVGDTDIIKQDGIELVEKMSSFIEGCKLCNIKYASHGFLNSNDEIILSDVYTEIKGFVL